ncbi:vesicle-associated membrane protein 7-like [Pectinophora gossypiella]|uniref:vesicle-associated membrane protein 7-like n=1 Tax=Pectinophora gossypiella TaxID=13191 RepID=UPI00214E4014|nr:vesicle-associated membrane protein 7-like [Pectinophora gossypiella]
MPILFSAVAYKKKFLSKYASCDGNFMEIAEEVLTKLPPTNQKMTYSHGRYLFHFIAERDHFYFCITDKICQRSRAFLFLNEIKRRFTRRQGSAFCQVLSDEMYRYSEDYNTIMIRKGELDELNTIGVGCSDSILGGKILFVNNPEELRYSTTTLVGETSYTPSIDNIECKRTSRYFFYIIITVILVLLWLVMSSSGPIYLVSVACICVLLILKFTKSKND